MPPKKTQLKKQSKTKTKPNTNTKTNSKTNSNNKLHKKTFRGSGIDLDIDGNLDVETKAETNDEYNYQDREDNIVGYDKEEAPGDIDIEADEDIIDEGEEKIEKEDADEDIETEIAAEEDADEGDEQKIKENTEIEAETAEIAVEEEREGGEENEENFDEGCFYNFAKKNVVDKDDDFNDDDYIDEIETEDDHNKKNINKKITGSDRITKPFLTKYERVRILCDRAKQLSLGAKPMLKETKNMTAKDIAKAELEKGVIPFKIERPLPNGTIELWKISELKISN